MKPIKASILLVLLIVTSLRVAAADVTAVVAWGQRVELGTLVSGVIHEVHVQPGQEVAAGDALVSLDRRGFASQVDRRSAELQHARAMHREAQRDDERAAELYDRTVLSDFERNQAAIALAAARAALGRARAQLVDAQLALERSVIKAPFGGMVLSVDAAPGQSIVSELQSKPLVTIGDVRKLRARALIDGGQAGALQAGTTLRASFEGADFRAQIAHIGFEPVTLEDGQRYYELLADLVVEPGGLRIGDSITLHLE